jgi:hypothetical protein
MNFIDKLICEVDAGLRTTFAPAYAERALPADDEKTAVTAGSVETSADPSAYAALDSVSREKSIRLMRVNHAGEVSAQALYQGQALVAKTRETRAVLEHAAREERDHLAWCASRLDELGGSTSRLNSRWAWRRGCWATNGVWVFWWRQNAKSRHILAIIWGFCPKLTAGADEFLRQCAKTRFITVRLALPTAPRTYLRPFKRR